MTPQCRLCLQKMFNMRNIMLYPKTADYELSIPESISIFFGIKVEAHDNYSKLLCANCLSLIQLMHIHRKKFQESQKLLQPIVKVERENIEEEEDDIPVLEAFFVPHKNSSGTDDGTTATLQSNKKESHSSEYIKIPKAYFTNASQCPRILIKPEERDLANSLLYYCKSKSNSEKRKRMMKSKYLHHVYNEGRPGAIRELIQCRAKKELYISEFDNNRNKLRSIYEYDVNLRPRTKVYDDQLWTVDLQLDVQVCTFCSKVFDNQRQLNQHQEEHRNFQMKMSMFKVIF